MTESSDWLSRHHRAAGREILDLCSSTRAPERTRRRALEVTRAALGGAVVVGAGTAKAAMGASSTSGVAATSGVIAAGGVSPTPLTLVSGQAGAQAATASAHAATASAHTVGAVHVAGQAAGAGSTLAAGAATTHAATAAVMGAGLTGAPASVGIGAVGTAVGSVSSLAAVLSGTGAAKALVGALLLAGGVYVGASTTRMEVPSGDRVAVNGSFADSSLGRSAPADRAMKRAVADDGRASAEQGLVTDLDTLAPDVLDVDAANEAVEHEKRSSVGGRRILEPNDLELEPSQNGGGANVSAHATEGPVGIKRRSGHGSAAASSRHSTAHTGHGVGELSGAGRQVARPAGSRSTADGAVSKGVKNIRAGATGLVKPSEDGTGRDSVALAGVAAASGDAWPDQVDVARSSLAGELALIKQARLALREKRVDEAARVLWTYTKRYPSGALGPEAKQLQSRVSREQRRAR